MQKEPSAIEGQTAITLRTIKEKGINLLNCCLYKYVITEGTGPLVASRSEVTLKMIMKVDGETILSYLDEPYVKVVEQILPPGLSFAVTTMCTNEHALLWMDSSLAFGIDSVPMGTSRKMTVNANILFDITLTSWTQAPTLAVDFRELSKELRLDQVHEKIAEAEELYAKGRKPAALRCYQQGRFIARKVHIDAKKEPTEEKARKKLVRHLSLQSAELALELAKFALAVTLSREVLEFDARNARANFILGSAYFALGYYVSAIRYVRRAHHAELKNEAYEAKMQYIEYHRSLVTEDVGFEKETEENEDFAESRYEELVKSERRFMKGAENFINRLMEEKKAKHVTIGGGFRIEFIQAVTNKLNSGSSYTRLNPRGDEVTLLL